MKADKMQRQTLRHSAMLPVQAGLLFLVLSGSLAQANAQLCLHIPEGGGQSIGASIVERYTEVGIPDGATVAPYTWVKVHSLAKADGRYIGMAQACAACPCLPTGFIYERTISHTRVYVDIISTALNGRYFLGNVYGKNPDGTAANLHELDTHANSTGPNMLLLAYPGVYKFEIKAFIVKTPCNMQPTATEEKYITIYVG